MSHITKVLNLNHFQGTATAYVVHLRHGRLVHQGVGQAFWFRRAASVLSEVPIADQELPAMVRAYTADHQDVSVQLTMTYRFADPSLAASRLEFGIVPDPPEDAEDGRSQAVAVLTRLAQSVVVADVAARPMGDVVGNVTRIQSALAQGLAADMRLAQIGVQIIDMHVLAVRPESDVEKALQTPLREQIQAEADKATYERRALAVERERQISENELASKIELASRTQQLVVQEGANARRQAEETAAAALIASKAQSERQGIDAEARAASIRVTGEAEAARTSALMAGYAGVDIALLQALALRDLAQALPKMTVGDITITPDLLSKA
ncbi:MAG: SPFH domain-containing protein, partial [Propionibacteriaceae bacterium]|nr:SPFH domain-containing protein [Propionibacteriaceae bacterium]